MTANYEKEQEKRPYGNNNSNSNFNSDGYNSSYNQRSGGNLYSGQGSNQGVILPTFALDDENDDYEMEGQFSGQMSQNQNTNQNSGSRFENNLEDDFETKSDNRLEGEPVGWNWKNIAIYACIATFVVGSFSGWFVRGFFMPSEESIRQSIAQSNQNGSQNSQSNQNTFIGSSQTQSSNLSSSSVASSQTSSVAVLGKFAVTKDPEKTNNGQVNVRPEACSTKITGTQSWGAVGKVLNETPVESTCFGKTWKWYQLEWGNGLKGWSVDNFLAIQETQPDLDNDVKLGSCTSDANAKSGCLSTETNPTKVKVPDNTKYTPELGKSIDDRQYVLNFCYNCTTQNVHLLQVYEYMFFDGFLNKVGDFSTSSVATTALFEKALDSYSKDGAKSNSSLQTVKSSQSSQSSSSSVIASSSNNSTNSTGSASTSNSASNSANSIPDANTSVKSSSGSTVPESSSSSITNSNSNTSSSSKNSSTSTTNATSN